MLCIHLFTPLGLAVIGLGFRLWVFQVLGFRFLTQSAGLTEVLQRQYAALAEVWVRFPASDP